MKQVLLKKTMTLSLIKTINKNINRENYATCQNVKILTSFIATASRDVQFKFKWYTKIERRLAKQTKTQQRQSNEKKKKHFTTKDFHGIKSF